MHTVIVIEEKHTPNPTPPVTVLPGLRALNATNAAEEGDSASLARRSGSEEIGDCAPGCMQKRVEGIGVNSFRLLLRTCNCVTAVLILIIWITTMAALADNYSVMPPLHRRDDADPALLKCFIYRVSSFLSWSFLDQF